MASDKQEQKKKSLVIYHLAVSSYQLGNHLLHVWFLGWLIVFAPEEQHVYRPPAIEVLLLL